MASQATIARLPPLNGEDAEEDVPLNSSSDVQNSGTLSDTEFQVNSVATVSALWQSDELNSTCHACQSEFNLINRRHHCRLCGNIFCQSCSNQKALVPPASIVLVPHGNVTDIENDDPDRMLTYISSNTTSNPAELLYGKGLEERLLLARAPLRVCRSCHGQLEPIQDELKVNSNAMRFNVIDPTDNRRLFNRYVSMLNVG